MPRHGRRPSFGNDAVAHLLGAMRTVRHNALICGSASGYNSARYKKCDALRKAIDDLAEDLTGDSQFYWDKVAPSKAERR